MSSITRVMALGFLVSVFLLSVGFSFFNTQQVPLSLGFMVLAAQPLALWVLGAFALGGILGLLLGSGLFRHWRKEREIAQLRARITNLEQALAGTGSVNNKHGR